jgi:hypothetical protein
MYGAARSNPFCHMLHALLAKLHMLIRKAEEEMTKSGGMINV